MDKYREGKVKSTPYHPQPDSRIVVTGIRSLIGFGNLVGPLAHSVLYLQRNSSEVEKSGDEVWVGVKG